MVFKYAPSDILLALKHNNRVFVETNSYRSIIEYPLSDQDELSTNFIYVFQKDKFVNKIYNVNKVGLYPNNNINLKKSLVLFAFNATSYDFGLTNDDAFDSEMKNIWKLMDFLGSLELSQFTDMYSLIRDCYNLVYDGNRKATVYCIDECQGSLKLLSNLLFSKELNTKEIEPRLPMTHFFGEKHIPKYISYMEALVNIIQADIGCYIVSNKQNIVYQLIDKVMDNMIDNFPEETDRFLKIKQYQVLDKMDISK